MFPKAAILTIFLLIALSHSAPPCDRTDPKSLCLKPLHRSKTAQPNAETLSPALRRRGGGGRRAGSAAAAGAVLGGAIAAGRKPRRGRRGGFGGDDEEEDEFEDEDGDGIDDDDEDDFCFPASAMVSVKGLGTRQMGEVQLGDSVLTSTGYSPVFVFTHRVTRGKFPFVRISTPVGALTASEGHYVYSSGRLVTAGSVKLGDVLDRTDGQITTVTSVEHVLEHGLYNPHTLTGDLVVDGFRVSAYTKAVEPVAANALLAPIRAAFRFLGVDITSGAMASTAPKSLLSRLPKGPAAAEL